MNWIRKANIELNRNAKDVIVKIDDMIFRDEAARSER